ncbi:MAG: oligosaccharide flippase family protein [Bacilli bacterium]|nr:oligosaccharide flippase family protein [Bacilli bacterium]
MKSKKLKKKITINSSFISMLIIVISNILSIIYVIPFHAIVGDSGGALYGYAYTLYSLFMSIAFGGIPLAINRIVNEYQTLGYHGAKKRVLIISKKIALLLGIVCFLILVLLAPLFAKAILGNLVGINSLKDITLVIRIMAIAVLVTPILNVYKGYFEGHRLVNEVSFSKHLEQVINYMVLIIGSFFALKVFKVSLSGIVSVALTGIIIGVIGVYIYLIDKKLKNKKKFDEKIRNVNEPIVSNKMIFRKIVLYAVPFIVIDLLKSLYGYIDMVTVVKGLVKYARFSVVDAETIMGMLSLWGAKFNLIMLSMAMGVVVKLIPSLSQSIAKKDNKEICRKVNRGLSITLFIMLPVTIAISFLAEPIWSLFYGASKYGASVLAYYIFVGLLMGLCAVAIAILQAMKDYKTIFASLTIGVLIKMLMNTSMIYTFHQYGMPGYYGVITASILAYLVSFIICLVSLYFKNKVEYEETVKNFTDILCGCMLMVVVLFLMKFIIPVVSEVRIINLFILLIYLVIGTFIYLLFVGKMGAIKNIFGNNKKK